MGVSLPCHFLGASLIIHNFIMFYALEDTSENSINLEQIILKMPGNNKLLTPLKQFFNLTVLH